MLYLENKYYLALEFDNISEGMKIRLMDWDKDDPLSHTYWEVNKVYIKDKELVGDFIYNIGNKCIATLTGTNYFSSSKESDCYQLIEVDISL